MTEASKAHLIAGTVTAAASCLASAVITTVVAIADPAETGGALTASVIVAAMGLWRARQIAVPDEYEEDDEDGEPTVAQDPTQRRIDRVLNMVEWEKISAVEGERLIDALRAQQILADMPAPPYGTPGGQS